MGRLAAETGRAAREATNAAGGFDSISRMAGQLKAAVAGYLSLSVARSFIETADAMSLLDSRLKLATKSSLEFGSVQKELFALAQENSVGISETVTLYTRMSEPLARVGGGMKEVIGVTNAFQKALQLGGVSAQEAAAATLQFGQALGSGTLAGDEFRSLAEASPRLLKAIADGAKLPIGELKKLGSEGKLTAAVVSNALLNVSGQLSKEFGALPDTVGKSMTRLANEVKRSVSEINNGSGLTLGIAGVVDEMTKLVPVVKAELGGAFQSVGEWLKENRDWIIEAWSATKGLAAEVWDVVKAAASVAGAVLQWVGSTGIVKTALESVQLVVAGLQDGIKFVGAAFATVGSIILKTVLAPVQVWLDAVGKIQGLIGNTESAAAYAKAAAGIREFAGAGAKYGDDVVAAFQRGETAVGRLQKRIEGASSAAKEAGKAATAPVSSFVNLKDAQAPADKAALAAAKRAAEDALQAQVALYRNADKAVLDSRQDFYTALSYEVKLGEKEHIQALGQGVDKEFEVWMQRSALLELELSAIAKKKDTQKEQAVILGKLADLERDYSQAATKASNEIKVAVRDQTIAYQEAEEAARSYLANITSQNSRDLAGLGMGNLQRDQDGRRNQRDDQYQGRKDQLAAQRRANEISPEVYAERLALEASTHAKILADDEAHWARRKELQSDWTLGASEALRNYADESANVYRQTESLVTNAFTGMEDALVKFATTGKLSFSDLAKSIIADMIRIQARAAMSSALSSIFGAFTGGSAQAAFSQTSLGSSGFGSGLAYGNQDMGRYFSSGGYTGSGGVHEPAGVVHKGEVVWSQSDVRKAGGVGVVEAMRLGKPGLSSGGIAGPKPAFYKPSAGGQDRVIVNNYGPPANVEAQEKRNPSGGMDFIVTIKKAIKDEVKGELAGEVATGRGNFSQALTGRYPMLKGS